MPIFSNCSLMLSQLLLWIIKCLFGVHLLEFPCISILLQLQLSVVVFTDLDLAIFAVPRNRAPDGYNRTGLIAATFLHYLPIVVTDELALGRKSTWTAALIHFHRCIRRSLDSSFSARYGCGPPISPCRVS